MVKGDGSVGAMTRLYYRVKPLLPRQFRWLLRRKRAARIRARSGSVWPINAEAGRTPEGWKGWPDTHRFAFVLTHDVEGADGVAKVRDLAEVEMRYGFRSSFNFIPEGEYEVPDELLAWLRSNGFEVGVHDLHHDGKLYDSRSGFRKKAEKINRYLEKWGATGFRSGFMLRELGWLHDLNIDYDCSTFDTDPFEPQPEGAHTIFPYWIEEEKGGAGYVELPYTLPQDSTLFLLLGEADPKIWLNKARWVIDRGGMVLVNVHPDYVDFGKEDSPFTFPVAHYEKLLAKIRDEYDEQAWCALPREVSSFVTESRLRSDSDPSLWPGSEEQRDAAGSKIWIDLENTPHVPFFRPIIESLTDRGHSVILTARDGHQTCELADRFGLNFTPIGSHHGKSRLAKAVGLVSRAFKLLFHVMGNRPDLVLNLGSRSQNLAAKLLGIPIVEIMDYEHTAEFSLLEPGWFLMPELVDAESNYRDGGSVIRTYEGLKEDVYVPFFKPNSGLVRELGLEHASLVVTARPPATDAHYHNPEAEELFAHFVDRALSIEGARVVILPRNREQEVFLRERYAHWFDGERVIVPERALDGLNLIWHSDLVVSGGGTMNREAAALGVPVYSVFRGPTGAVDRHLAETNRLTLLETLNDVETKVLFESRQKSAGSSYAPRKAMTDILTHLDQIISTLGESSPVKKAAI